MFVAVYEAKFRVRLEGVVRNPVNEEDYAQNVQLVIDVLQDKIHIGLHHITGLAISNGDKKAITNLIRILSHVVTTTG